MRTGIDNGARATGGVGRVRGTVARAFREVAAAHDRKLQPLDDDLVLVDCGLDSLCFAVIAAELEIELGLDPLAELEDDRFPASFGAFVALYEAASVIPGRNGSPAPGDARAPVWRTASRRVARR